jgi:RNA polymerase sigma factor (sigma-70 family)
MRQNKDYLLTVSIKNNLLLSMMKAQGIDTLAELSRRSGISKSEIGQYLRLAKSAYRPKNGEIRSGVKRLCEFFHCLPDQIFPEEHLHTPLTTNSSSVEISMEELKSIHGIMAPGPDAALIDAEANDALYTALSTLTDKQQKVLQMRFGLDGKEHTLVEIGENLGLSATRIMEIEQKALRILRRPINSKVLETAFVE